MPWEQFRWAEIISRHLKDLSSHQNVVGPLLPLHLPVAAARRRDGGGGPPIFNRAVGRSENLRGRGASSNPWPFEGKCFAFVSKGQ